MSDLSSQTIPRGMRYSEVRPSGTQGSTFFANFPSSGQGSYTQNQIVEIPISNPSAFLDGSHSYFTAKITLAGLVAASGRTMICDGGLAGCIQRIRLLTNMNQEICSIQNYGRLNVMMSDFNRAMGKTNVDSIAEGLCRNIDDLSSQAKWIEGDLDYINNFTLAIPLHLLPFVGPNSAKYVPLPLLQGGLKIEILLASNNEWLKVTNALDNPSYTLSEVNYVGAMVTPTPSFMQAFRMVASQVPITLNGNSFLSNAFTTSASANPQNVSYVVPSTLKSARSIFAWHYPTSNTSDKLQYSISNRFWFSTTGFYLNIAGQPVPNYQINNISQLYTELIKAFGKLTNVSTGGTVDYTNYFSDDTGSRFCAGIDLDVYQDSAVMAGRVINSVAGQQLVVYLTMDNNNVNSITNVSILYDLELVINPDGSILVVY